MGCGWADILLSVQPQPHRLCRKYREGDSPIKSANDEKMPDQVGHDGMAGLFLDGFDLVEGDAVEVAGGGEDQACIVTGVDPEG